MGYALAYAACFGCNKLFGFNPLRVPSFNNQPICQACVDLINPKRIANGLEPIVPAFDAYDACDEGELE